MSNKDEKDHLGGSGPRDNLFMGYVGGGNRFYEISKSSSIGFAIDSCMGNLTIASRNCNAAIVSVSILESLRSKLSNKVSQGRAFIIVRHLTSYKAGFRYFNDASKSQYNPCRNLVVTANEYSGTSSINFYFIHAVIVSSYFFQYLIFIGIHSNKWNYLNCQIE